MQRGWCVVDGGATKTLGSVQAVQRVLDCNQAEEGRTKLLGVDTQRQPTFSFGNSSENRCVSTVEVGIKAGAKNGRLTIHALDQGSGPILLSVASLRALNQASSAAALPAQVQNSDTRLQANMSLNSMKKQELQNLLHKKGENPPERWTKLELKQRLIELDPNLEEASSSRRVGTELQQWVHKINKASAKKAHMVALCETEMGLQLKGTETVAQMERQALQHAYRVAAPAAEDVVGFGKFAALEYQDINRYQPGYREWILKTDAESHECDYRLKRLATWLRANPSLPKDKSVEDLLVENHKSASQTGKSSKASASSTTSGEIMQVLQQLAGVVQNLQEDVAEMREERPRRKESRKPHSETTSEGYQKIEPQWELSAQSARYTRAYVERAATALLLELNHVAVYQVVQEDPQVLEHQPEEVMYSKEEICNIESQAKELLKRQDFSLDACEALIKGMQWRARVSREGKLGSERVHYHAFGAYSYGANHGVCTSTKQFPKFLKYLNMFLTRQTKTPRKWTSLVVNINNRMPTHRDVHNQANQPNVVIGLGKYEQGGLWVQETVQAKEMGITGISQGPLEARTTPHGEVIWGRSHKTRGLKEHCQFLVAIDEGSRTLRLDPAGNFRSQAVQAVQGLKTVMDKLYGSEETISAEEALATAVRVFNQRDLVGSMWLVLLFHLSCCVKTPTPNSNKPYRGRDPSLITSQENWCSTGVNRRASQREELIDVMAEQDRTPWTFNRVAEQIGGNQFEDVSGQLPSTSEWWRAQEPTEEAPPVRVRFRGKRAATAAPPEDSDEELIPDAGREPASSSRRRPRTQQASFVDAVQGSSWWDEVSKSSWASEEQAFWSDKGACVEVEIEMPQSGRDWQRAVNAFEKLPEHLKPSYQQAIGMRWILTWKQKEAARRNWTVFKGDVSGAFLQGREYPDVLHCVPCDEICDQMQVPRGSVTRLKRACYGLVDAPLEWYRSVSEFLEGIGLERTWSDACTWVWRVEGELRGMVSGHVDDFLFGGSDRDKGWQNIIHQIQQRFQWGDWEKDSFVQCGVKVDKVEDGYLLSQPQFVDGLKEINLNATRRRQRESETNEREKGQLRALLGSLSWLAQQSAPHLSAAVSLLLSEVTRSTIDTVIRSNLLLQNVRQRRDHQMLIHAMPRDEPVMMFAWVDAANANRPDGGSTQGIFVGLGPRSMMSGAVGKVTPVTWHSSKVDRVCRSPGAAEALAAVNGEDALYYARYQWSELEYGMPDVRDAQGCVSKVPGCVVTDSRNVYDKLNNEVLVVKGAEKRTDLELLGLKEAQAATGLSIRWVHSEAQLANSLTKVGNCRELELYYKMRHQWRIVEDDQMRSARKRKQEGMAPLAGSEEGKIGECVV
ncbi:RE1 [Symbiodinium sp. KB8]|nr:RE1 [Symbiodinium sp. KB8]